MAKSDIRSRIISLGIVPVIRASSAEKALMAVDALYRGGVSVVEVTLTVPGAEKVIESLRQTSGSDLLIGAGSVKNVAAAQRCLDAGAQFIISPGFDSATVELVRSNQVLMIAGALTPTEVLAAWNSGADLVKIFPCNAVGGPAYIKALKGPMPEVPLIPTGGVNLRTAADFIEAGSEALGIGSELVQTAALAAGTPNVITELAKQFLDIVRSARSSKPAAAVLAS
jgi:2-dehydro-3-deoxyphosphogluconate aldolase/(4S)-4-hydroxy-2-oxoglutarate aldolase